jgi:hypothetical protein
MTPRLTHDLQDVKTGKASGTLRWLRPVLESAEPALQPNQREPAPYRLASERRPYERLS